MQNSGSSCGVPRPWFVDETVYIVCHISISAVVQTCMHIVDAWMAMSALCVTGKGWKQEGRGDRPLLLE